MADIPLQEQIKNMKNFDNWEIEFSRSRDFYIDYKKFCYEFNLIPDHDDYSCEIFITIINGVGESTIEVSDMPFDTMTEAIKYMSDWATNNIKE